MYGTDEGRSRKTTGGAKQKHAGIDTGRVTYATAKYSRKDLDASLDRMMEAAKSSDAAHLEVYSAAAAPDGSGIQVTAAASALDHVRAQFTSNGIPVTVTAGAAPRPFTWRWNDGRAFIGGDVLIGDGHKAGSTVQCTAGLAADGNPSDDGHGVPCGITVTNDDVRYNLTWNDGTVVTVRGVKGSSSGWVGEQGDSGALVFSITGSSTRQARGTVSGGEGGTLYWTEAPDILNSWNLHLNPHT